jgi:N-acetylglucosaminyldiphosphoundecaprenol N-acetyl-beta-D-mannosaminyltransferase
MIIEHEHLPVVKALGSAVYMISLEQFIGILISWIETGSTCRMAIISGFHGLYRASIDPYYRQISHDAELWVPDGIAPVLLGKLDGIKNVRRTPGMEVMTNFFEVANKKGFSSFFYGDTCDTLEKLEEILLRKYPNHKIAGTYSPPFHKLTIEEDQKIIEDINKSHPDIIWVGLGLPKQDIWAYEHKDKLNAKVVIGVGAAFCFLAGKVPRCPEWIGNIGFEWLYRLIKEPRRLWKRYLIEGPSFIWKVVLEWTGLKKYDYDKKFLD